MYRKHGYVAPVDMQHYILTFALEDMCEVPGPVIALANAVIALATLPPNTHFDSGQVAKAYRNALRERGLLKGRNNDRLYLSEVGRQYSKFVEPMRSIDELMALPATEEEASREVARFAREPRSNTHPLRHLALIAWLFGGMEQFVISYGESDESSPSNDRACITGKGCEPAGSPDARQQFLGLLAAGKSVTGAAREIGVDPATGMAWAASAGIQTAKRPSVIKNDVRQKMLGALRRGSPKAAAARVAGVSVQSVTRLLRTEVGLRDAWREARFASTQRSARRKWLQVVAANPLSGVKAARMLEPAAYGCLYRWDRNWLDAKNELVSRPQRSGGARVDWDARDQHLANEVAVTGLELANAMPGSRIKLWQLYQRIPELRAKLSALDRLPLTRDAVRRVLRASTVQPALVTATRRLATDDR